VKRILASLFKPGSSEVIGDEGGRPEEPKPGQIWSFRTTPFSEFAPPKPGRHAAFKIIGVDAKYVSVAVLDGIWSAAPTPKDLQATSILEEHRFAHTGRPAVFGVNRDWWTPAELLEDLQFVGTQALSLTERSYADSIARLDVGTSFATIHRADYAAEGEWRWSNDREAFVAEAERKRVKSEAERKAKEERYRNRLSELTWEQLLSETPFERWSPSPPFPPEEFTEAARAVIRNACSSLRALGPKPRKAEVRAILKKTVLWFNEEDEKAGGPIETEEREDICAVLEEMAHVARQTSLIQEIDDWREW
jgi:hypothetical protein